MGFAFTGTITGNQSNSVPFMTWVPSTPPPSVSVVSVASVNVPTTPTASLAAPDASINSSSPVTITLQAAYIPVGTVLTLHVFSDNKTDQNGSDDTACRYSAIVHGNCKRNVSERLRVELREGYLDRDKLSSHVNPCRERSSAGPGKQNANGEYPIRLLFGPHSHPTLRIPLSSKPFRISANRSDKGCLNTTI